MQLYFFKLLILLFWTASPTSVVAQPLNERDKLSVRKPNLTDTVRINELNAKSHRLALSQPLQSEKYREQAFELSKSLQFVNGYAWNYYLKGIQYTHQDNYLKAIVAETEAIRQAQKTDNYEMIARSYNVIGLCNTRLNDYDQAKVAFQKALKAISKSADKNYRSAVIHNMGTLYMKQKKFEKGFDHFNQAAALNIKSGNKQWLAQNYLEIAQAHYGLKDLKKAEAYGQRSLLFARGSKNNRCEIQSLALLGSINIKLRNLSLAKLYLDSGYSKAVSAGKEFDKLTFYEEYAAWYVLRKNYQKAYEFRDRYASVHDSLNKQSRSKVVLEYQEKFRMEQREAEYNRLKKEQTLSKGKILQKNYLLLLFTVLLVALFVFSGYFFWSNKKIRLSNSLLLLRNQEIEKQKADVEHLNYIKDKLFSVIAHDLRSPFANMKSMMDLYDEGMISKEEVDFFLKEIGKDMGSSTLLLENLLIWAKSQLAGFKLQAEPVSIRRIVDEVAFFKQKKMIDKGIVLSNEVESADAAYADYEMIKAVVMNLVGNAIKFTPQNGTIRVSAMHTDGMLEIFVRDSGIGMSPEQKAQLFQTSFISTRGLNKEKGAGLGLQICKDFVEKNGGRIWLQSSGGHGSTFCFTLPKSAVPPEEQSIDAGNGQELARRSLREMVKNNMALQYRFELYELIAKVTNDTVYDMNVLEDEINWNESFFSNFGYRATKSTLDWWLQRVHPEDQKSIGESINMALANGDSKWEYQYQFRCEDGSYKYVSERGLILLDEESGKPVRMIGIMQNIQEQKTANHQIERLSLVAKNVNNLVVISDADDRVVWVNKAFEAHTGYMLEEILSRIPSDFLSGPQTDENTLNGINDHLCEKTAFSTELINYKKSGQPYWVQIDCTPYHDPISNQVGYVAIQTVITERKKHEELILKNNEAFREIARISSHEVRRPLCSIMGLVKLIESDLNEHELADCLHLLNQSAAELDSLIHNIHKHIVRIEGQHSSLSK